VEEWLGALHMARVFGMPYRIVVAMIGVAVSVLAVTGVWVWARRRLVARRERSGRSRRGA